MCNLALSSNISLFLSTGLGVNPQLSSNKEVKPGPVILAAVLEVRGSTFGIA